LKPIAYGAIRHALIHIGSDGKFRVEGAAIREYRLLISGIPATHYLKEVRYNGQPQAGTIFSMDRYALAHSLDLVFDDKPAALTGVVKNDDKTIEQPHVVLVPSPCKDPEVYLVMLTVAGDESGRFNFAGLAPGGDKVFAVPAESKRRLERRDVLDRLLSGAEEVSMGPNQVRNIDLKLSKP
jgi:hypothetical protein